MKNLKKIRLVLSVIFLVFIGSSFFSNIHHVSAAGPACIPLQYTVCSNRDIFTTTTAVPTNFKMSTDRQIIDGTFYNSTQEAGIPIKFFFQGAATSINYGPGYKYIATNVFCSGMDGKGGIFIPKDEYENPPATEIKDAHLDVDWYDLSSNHCNDYNSANPTSTQGGSAPGFADISIDTSTVAAPGGGGSTQACGTLQDCLSGNQDSSACIANSSTTLEWLLCPVITAVSKFSDVTNNYIEGQLNYQVDDNLKDINCNTGESPCPVYKAWSIIKNIVSGLVVVLMLVMVISQAVGSGLLDAYTIKKHL